MLQPCPLCGANVLDPDTHAEFHTALQHLEERVAEFQIRLSEIGSVMSSQASG